MVKCQCEEKGVLHDYLSDLYDKKLELPFVAHEPHECKCTNNIKKYDREGKKLYLCSCCVLGTDVEVYN